MSEHTLAPRPSKQGWPEPTADQLSLVARLLGPHVQRARAERLAAEQAALIADGRAAA